MDKVGIRKQAGETGTSAEHRVGETERLRKAFTREDDREWGTKYIKGNKNQVSHYTMGESKRNPMESEIKLSVNSWISTYM